MERILNRYINSETGVVCIKRLVVKEVNGLFRVYQETDRGYGEGFVGTPVPSIKPYKTAKGAEKALRVWQPPQYRMTLVEGLMQEGKI
jgi:hypothetical protein